MWRILGGGEVHVHKYAQFCKNSVRPRDDVFSAISMTAAPVLTPHLNVHGLEIRDTGSAGRGVFATRSIAPLTVVEISPVLLFSGEEYAAHGRHTQLDSYTFVWEKRVSGNVMALALGIGVYLLRLLLMRRLALQSPPDERERIVRARQESARDPLQGNAHDRV